MVNVQKIVNLLIQNTDVEIECQIKIMKNVMNEKITENLEANVH